MTAPGGPAPSSVATPFGGGPVERYVRSLESVLSGPARAKARLLQEIRDGLDDATEAFAGLGMDAKEAARAAVRDCGDLDEVAAGCQRELGILQARRTARVVLLTVPLVLVSWYALWLNSPEGGLPRAVQVMAVQMAVVAVAAAGLAAVTLAATGPLARRVSPPPELPSTVAWAGTAAAVAMAFAALSCSIASFMVADWSLIAAASLVTVASHVPMASSARACRESARPPEACPH